MKQERLKIVNLPPKRLARKMEAQAKFERIWETQPEKLFALRNCTERERIERSWDLLSEYIELKGLLVADLGCGSGVFARRLHEAKAIVHAVDISRHALKHLPTEIKTIQDTLPSTTLDDDTYDALVCLDVIAHLNSKEYRLLISELARLIKREGVVLCSTPIDIDSEDALHRFIALAQTEFTISKWVFSYHRLHIRLQNFFEIPVLKTIGKPFAHLLQQNRWLMLCIEKVCKFFYSESGISHAIFIGKRRPLVEAAKETEQIRLGKKQIWE